MKDNKIHWQHCFRIPRPTLPIFVTKVTMCSEELSHFHIEYVFEYESEDGVKMYDVIVNETGGRYPHVENDLKNFQDGLWRNYQTKQPPEIGGGNG